MNRLIAIIVLTLIPFLSGCATLTGSGDAPSVRVVGFEPLPSEGLEARFTLKLRVQNPNESTLTYNGLSVKLDLDGRGLASGVSDATGTIPRFSEEVLSIPVSISAFSALRQLLALSKSSQNGDGTTNRSIAYKLTGKLGAAQGSFGTTRFSDKGNLDFFADETVED